jgi:beta,beta-carotene 9',10'-dioxygenase
MPEISAPPTAEQGLRALHRETTLDDLPVRGELPSWLSGSLLRTGPAEWEVGKSRLRHWFDGHAMLHRFTFAEGRVSYANRFLDSEARRAAVAAGRITFGEFATDPCRSIFQRVQSLFAPSGSATDNGNVNIARLGDRFLALTESSIPVEFDRRTLAAAGAPFHAPGQISTAHPHRDRDTGAMLNYAAKLGPRSSYRFFRVSAETVRPEVIASLPVREPAYMHSFGLTERWFVLAEFPLVVNPAQFAVAGKPFIENYRWKPERGTRFTLVDRHTGEVGATFTADPCFAFHHVNAYEEGDDVVVDMCAYDDASIIQDLYLDRLRGLMRDSGPIQQARLTRFRLSPESGLTTRQLSDEAFELPRINGAYFERPYRYTWGAGIANGWFENLVRIDVTSGESRRWRESGCYPGEPVFVRRPAAEREDDGALLSIVFNAHRATSFLLVLDAATLEEIARADVPHHIPFHFHGQFTTVDSDQAG